jgi:hypothetical protein
MRGMAQRLKKEIKKKREGGEGVWDGAGEQSITLSIPNRM